MTDTRSYQDTSVSCLQLLAIAVNSDTKTAFCTVFLQKRFSFTWECGRIQIGDNMVQIGNDWDELLKDEFQKEYYQKLRVFLAKEYKTQTIYPRMMFTILNPLITKLSSIQKKRSMKYGRSCMKSKIAMPRPKLFLYHAVSDCV